MKTIGSFDYVIAGGGTAGCVLANRLSADPSVSVLMLEAGGRDKGIWIHIPVGYLFCIGNPRTDWCYRIEPDPGLHDRTILYARGRVLGGCTPHLAVLGHRPGRALAGARRPRGPRPPRRGRQLQLRTAFKVQNARTLNTLASSWWGKVKMGLQYAFWRTGPLAMAPSQMGACAKSDPDQPTANIEFHVQPLSLDKFGDPLHAFGG